MASDELEAASIYSLRAKKTLGGDADTGRVASGVDAEVFDACFSGGGIW